MATAFRVLWRLAAWLMSAAFYATPLLAFWLASSLASYMNGPIWLPWAAGLIVFPVLPLAWELRGRRRTRRPPDQWIFTTAQRLSLRTFVVAAAFIAALLTLFPRNAFVALSMRGDWMLDGITSPQADGARQVLFGMADGLEWLYRLANKNPYDAFVEHQVDRVAELIPDSGAACPLWPWKKSELHPLVSSIPASEEGSIESVARYIARGESDPFQRVKALHDWVADRISYDAVALATRNFPPQDAVTVFHRRTAVCAGYSNLLAALGEAVHLQIPVVTGDVRTEDGRFSGVGHAWNAARVEGRWYLIDSTFDSGTVGEKGFSKHYSTEYLFAPPRAMILDHFPKLPRWQLLEKPLFAGDFLRQPMLRPAWVAAGLELVTPRRAQTEVSGRASILIKNPSGRWLLAEAERDGQKVEGAPEATASGTALLEYRLPGKGTYRVKIFQNGERSGSYSYVGALDFVSS